MAAAFRYEGRSRTVARAEAAGSGEEDSDSRSGSSSGSTDDAASGESDETSSGEEHGQCMDESRGAFELRFETIFREEKLAIEARRLARSDYGEPGVPFSVAFSGGGVRAASFQAGVLWRLAVSGKLKDVEYLCAVSGGGYIASGFASHCLEAEPPRRGAPLEAWYLDRVAETLCRMQANISYLVRDIAQIPGSERHTEGSGMFHRALDVPILVAVLISTFMTFPVIFTFMYLIPFTEVVDLFFGSAARMAFCAEEVSPWRVFLGSYHMRMLVGMAGVAIISNFVIFVMWKVLPPCRLRRSMKRSGRPPRNACWLLGQSSLAALTRLICLILLCLAVVMVLTDMEIWEWDYDADRRAYREKVCSDYIQLRRQNEHWVCSDLEEGIPWWDHRMFDAIVNEDFEAGEPTMGFVREALKFFRANVFKYVASMWKVTIGIFAILLAISLILLPCVDFLLIWMLFLIGPVCLFMASVGFVRWRVFSPITKQGMPPAINAPFNLEGWAGVVFWTFILDIAMVPIYQFVRANMHRFYARSLQRAYFARGIDKTWKQLKDGPFCPFLLLTGTVNDYVRADSDRAIHEISFSFLHTGSDTLGYVRCRRPKSLAKCTALTGAASDAFILGMLDRIRYRFWLEVLNLAMGDFIPFRRRERPIARTIKRKLGLPQHLASQFVYKLPSCLLITVFYGLLLRALLANQRGEGHCDEMRIMTRAALVVGVASFVLSFFGFLPCFKFLLHQPGIRQLHQAMRYYHRAARPPNLIYVTDGGVQDCTGILQLIRRRRSRILLALAAADPADELAVLRTTMEDAAREKLASFYDPRDPRRDVRVTLDEFQRDPERCCLHLGMHFGWGDAGAPETGHLVVVKNRLPPSMAQEPVRPLLTEEDIKRPGEVDHDVAGDLKQTDLGACCCDCCHTHGLNFASKFPHHSNANQCMTPQMFNSLCRLGFTLSAEAVELISRPESLDRPWEQGVSQTLPESRQEAPAQAGMVAAGALTTP